MDRKVEAERGKKQNPNPTPNQQTKKVGKLKRRG